MLRHWKSISLSKYVILSIGFILIFIVSNTNWGKNKWQNTIESDAKGYYAYNPAVFIYHDLNFKFFKQIDQEKYYQKHLFVDYRSFLKEGVVNKYYVGTAIAQAPFFLMAHGIAHSTDYDADGYSKIYMQFINLAAVFYCLLGLFFLGKTFDFYQISERNKSLCFLITVFGTNLFIYTIAESGMSHVYSFGFVSMFVYFVHVFFYKEKSKALIILGFLLGLICLIRPVNGLVVFSLFFIAGKPAKDFFLSLLKYPKQLILGFIGFILIVSIQSLIYYISTGAFWVNSYQDEGFNFLNPHFFDILFSYQKGLFLYTPIYLVSFIGLVLLYKKAKLKVWYWLAFFALVTYVSSSWWMWYYGGSFSSRVYVEYLPFFMILLAIALQELKTKLVKQVFLISCILLTVLCQIQSYQYRYYIVHYSEMNQEKYWEVFLQLKKSHKAVE